MIAADLRIPKQLRVEFGLALAEAAEEGKGIADHGVVGTGMLHGSIYFVFDCGYRLEQELAEIAKRGSGLVRDAFLGEGGEDFAEDVVYVGDGVELAGKGSELGGELVRFEKLLLFAGVMNAERGMVLFAKHAAGAAIGELATTLVGVGIGGVWLHWNLGKNGFAPPHNGGQAQRHREHGGKSCRKTFQGMLLRGALLRLGVELYPGIIPDSVPVCQDNSLSN